MGKAKITPIQVYIIGVVLAIIAAVAIYFALIQPGQNDLAAAQAKYDTAKQQADKKVSDEADRKKAIAEVAAAESSWARYDRAYMMTRVNGHLEPIVDTSNLLRAMQQLWREQIMVLQPKVENFIKADHNVQVASSSLALPAPPSDPNQVNKKAYIFDLGSVTVVGTFNDVLNDASRWNKFDRLVLMDNLTLSGNSPRLAGTYSLRCFEFTKSDKVGDQIPQASGGGNFGGNPGDMPPDAQDTGMPGQPPPP